MCDMQGHNCFRRNFFSMAGIPGKGELCPFCSAHPDCELTKYEAYQTKLRIGDPLEICGNVLLSCTVVNN